MTDPSPKQALVVGASRGIGLAVATELAARGWRVTATARTAGSELAAAAAAAAAVGEAGAGIAVELVDIDRDAEVDALNDRLSERLGDQRFDLLLVNAGVTGPRHQSTAQATPDEVAALFGTNAVAPVRLARKFMRLLAPGATLAFTSSVMGSIAENTSGGMELYRASKAALNALTRSLAAELAADAARGGSQAPTVLTLHPGWVRTAMGGPDAPLSVGDSARGLVDVIQAQRPAGHHFLDYSGRTVAW